MTKPAPRRWGRFTHLTPYHRGNSIRGIQHAARTTGAIDIDVQVTKDGVLVGCHWSRPLLRDGFRDPAGKIGRHRTIGSMTYAEAHRLRTKDGYRIWRLTTLLKIARRHRVRVEIEAKESRALERRKTWEPIAALVERQRMNVVVKTISDLPTARRAGRRLRAAHRAGLTTMLLPRRACVMHRRFKPYVDYVRGRVRWIGRKK